MLKVPNSGDCLHYGDPIMQSSKLLHCTIFQLQICCLSSFLQQSPPLSSFLIFQFFFLFVSVVLSIRFSFLSISQRPKEKKENKSIRAVGLGTLHYDCQMIQKRLKHLIWPINQLTCKVPNAFQYGYEVTSLILAYIMMWKTNLKCIPLKKNSQLRFTP